MIEHRCGPSRSANSANSAPSLADGPERARTSGDAAAAWDFVTRVRNGGSVTRSEADAVLAALAMLGVVREHVDRIEHDLLETARAAHVTWQEIASATGRGSAQAAEQRALRLRMKVAKEDKDVPRQVRGDGHRAR